MAFISVFICRKHCATAAKPWCGMQSTKETDLESTCFNPRLLLYKHPPGAEQSLSVFPSFNYRLQLQNLSLFCKNCEGRNASSSPTEHRYRVFYEICDSLVPN